MAIACSFLLFAIAIAIAHSASYSSYKHLANLSNYIFLYSNIDLKYSTILFLIKFVFKYPLLHKTFFNIKKCSSIKYIIPPFKKLVFYLILLSHYSALFQRKYNAPILLSYQFLLPLLSQRFSVIPLYYIPENSRSRFHLPLFPV